MKRMMIAALTLCLSGSAMAQTYQDTSLPAAVRAKAMVKELTLDEKISLMMNESPAIPRLGIKAYEWWNEALHGVGRSGLATVFPQCIGMAASFDDGLLNRVYTAVSDEARAKNNQYKQAGLTKRYQGLTFWTPNVNIFRDPRWGRGQETYGEDPYLTSVMGVAVVKGLQGPADSKYDKAHACAKHFAVHSGPEWNRHSFDAAQIAPRDLWETYMPAFKSLVQKANVKEVMCAYNRFEGEPCCDNNRLLQQILRNEWGYQGIVVSDCWAINDIFTPGHHATELDSAHATAKAVYAGTDLECGGSYESLRQAVEQGLISEERINQSVERLLTARYELGEMDGKTEWDQIPASVVDCQQHRDLALKMAKESIVLLKNGKIEEWKNGSILPLSKHLKVALMGPNMNDSVMQWGNYNGFPSHTTTLEAALRQRLTPDQLIVEPGCGHTSATRLESLFDKCSIDGQPGFRASYWNQMRPAGAPVTTVQVKEPFHFTTLGATVFAPGVNLSNFSGMYQTTFTPDKSETISFAFDTDGYCLLTVDGKEILRGGHLTSTHAATLQVEAGKSYDIRLVYAATNESVKLNFDMGRELPQDLAENVARVKDADVVIFAGGITPDLEGEEKPVSEEGFKGGDRTRIELPAIQLELLRQLKAAGKRVIFVNYSGSALALPEVDEFCDAIVQAWYPGQAGGEAVAQVLFGEYNPAGRLPVTFYKSMEQLPDFEDYSMKGRTYRYMTEQPLYPFGYGLSYTSFKYGKARLSSKSMKAGHETTLSIPITNIGKQDGEEVVQVYVSRPDDTEGPARALRAFRRVVIPKGQTVTVEIPLNAESLEWFDPQTNTMRAIPGTYELHYGGSSSLSDLQELAITFKR